MFLFASTVDSCWFSLSKRYIWRWPRHKPSTYISQRGYCTHAGNQIISRRLKSEKIPRRTLAMIFPTMLCQAVTVKPPPYPCQISREIVKNKAIFGPILGMNQDTATNPQNGDRSWMVKNITISLYRFCWATISAIYNWGNCHLSVWTAGIRPIRIAESVSLLTNRSNTVEI